MMFGALETMVLRGVGYAWQIAYDFMPAKTMEEVSHVVGDVRQRLFPEDDGEVRQRVENALITTRAAHGVLARSGASAQATAAVAARAKVLEQLLEPVATKRDVMAGSLSEVYGDADWEWSRVGDHPSTLGYFANNARRFAGRLLDGGETHDESLKLRAKMQVQRQLLKELRGKLKPEYQGEIDARLNALDFAQKVAMRSDQRADDPTRPSESGAGKPRKKDIPID